MRLLSLQPDDLLITPKVTLSIGFRDLVPRLPAIHATGLLAFTLEGLTPSEHTSLIWTHKRPPPKIYITLDEFDDYIRDEYIDCDHIC